MLLLTSTSDLVSVVTSSNAELDVHASYADYNGTLVTPGRQDTIINSVTTTTLVGSPSGGITRNVKCLMLHNKDSASSNIVKVTHTDGTNTPVLFQYTLLAGETLQYWDGSGWSVMDANGGLKTSARTGLLLKRSVLTSGIVFTTGLQTNSVFIR